MMPCNTSGFFSPSNAARYGVADFDWSNAREACELLPPHLAQQSGQSAAQSDQSDRQRRAGANAQPMDCEERLVTQAAMVKEVNPRTKVWVYRATPAFDHVLSL